MSTDLERIGHALYGLDAAIRSVGVMLILVARALRPPGQRLVCGDFSRGGIDLHAAGFAGRVIEQDEGRDRRGLVRRIADFFQCHPDAGEAMATRPFGDGGMRQQPVEERLAPFFVERDVTPAAPGFRMLLDVDLSRNVLLCGLLQRWVLLSRGEYRAAEDHQRDEDSDKRRATRLAAASPKRMCGQGSLPRHTSLEPTTADVFSGRRTLLAINIPLICRT